MNILAKIFLSTLFFVFFLAALLTTSTKFQLLDSDFWIDRFRKEDVYPNLTSASKEAVERLTLEKGGSVVEARVITNFLTEEIVQKTFERNLANFLSFVNGSAPEIYVFLPSELLSSRLLPRTVAIKEEAPLTTYLSLFGASEAFTQNATFQLLPQGSILITTSWSITLFLTLLVIFSIYKLTEPGKRLTHLGVTLLLSTLLVGALITILDIFRVKGAKELLVQGRELPEIFIAILVPPIVKGMTALWGKLAVALAAVGFLTLLLERPKKKGKANV